jgi:hypothetical protein
MNLQIYKIYLLPNPQKVWKFFINLTRQSKLYRIFVSVKPSVPLIEIIEIVNTFKQEIWRYFYEIKS